MRTADIYVFGKLAGALTENDDGKFSFLYNEAIHKLVFGIS